MVDIIKHKKVACLYPFFHFFERYVLDIFEDLQKKSKNVVHIKRNGNIFFTITDGEYKTDYFYCNNEYKIRGGQYNSFVFCSNPLPKFSDNDINFLRFIIKSYNEKLIIEECYKAFNLSFNKNGDCPEVDNVYQYCVENNYVEYYKKAYDEYYGKN